MELGVVKPREYVFVNRVRLPSDVIVEFFVALCSLNLHYVFSV
jgi:hypothetical protein